MSLYYVHIYIMRMRYGYLLRDSRTCETCAYVVYYMYYYVSKNVDYINHSNLLSRSFYQLDARAGSS